jgi:two-component system, NarL family, sensor histidine kinase BarA
MTQPESFEALTTTYRLRLDELVDRGSLTELVQGFYELFRVPVRLFAEGMGLLVSAGTEPALYGYLRKFTRTRIAVEQTVARVANRVPELEEVGVVECFTGAAYQVTPIAFDGRRIGRVVLGPYLPATVKTVPQSLLELDATLDASEVKRLLAALPRAKDETLGQISSHLHKTLDLILWNGHKAALASSTHILAVRESFRELQEKNASLEAAFERLKELDRLKSNFLATVSHELRTPLTSIIGYSQMLKDGLAGALTQEQAEFATTIFDKGNQLLELIVGLLDLSKMETGTLALRVGAVDVTRLVDDVLTTLRPAALKTGVELFVRVDSGLGAIEGDPTRLRQVLLNLVDNALKFTPAGGRVEICAERGSLSRRPDGDEGAVLFGASRPAVILSVSDTGIGITDDDKERVFDPFFQVDSGTTRQTQGIGLGLAIVRRLVEAHGGTVTVEDNVPKGVRFVVALPSQGSKSH